MASRCSLVVFLYVIVQVCLTKASDCPAEINQRCRCPGNGKLDCSSSDFDDFPMNISSSNMTIRELNLEDNKIKSLPDEAFLELHQDLSVINLKNNQLEDVGASFNISFPQLNVLDLSYNKLNSTDAFDLSKMPALDKLLMSSNMLTNLGELGLSPTNLTYLELANNKITTLGKLQGLHNLKTLGMDYNKMEVLLANAFQGMWSLTDLKLNDNDIREIVNNAFDGLGSVMNLSLSHNKLKQIDERKLAGLNQIQQLHLNDNLLESIQLNQPIPSLKYIDVTGNNLTCNDNLLWVWDWKQSTNHEIVGECHMPGQRSIKSLTDVTEEEFLGKIEDKDDDDVQITVTITLNGTAEPTELTPSEGGLAIWIIIVIVVLVVLLIIVVVVCGYKILSKSKEPIPVTTNKQTRIFYNHKYDSVKQSGQRSKDVYADLTTEL
ncbi:uncharacterized protein LOC100370316 [Saccoglossus kowalevskii]|uniref:Connectin-like n=1 Tax=Saccoglossus kowalevskii TaxID=10224 RepID=A0ABM0MFQ6_SACKO|nr:PREDICTED: connectin-like [Saccoglossus kowalevskii]